MCKNVHVFDDLNYTHLHINCYGILLLYSVLFSSQFKHVPVQVNLWIIFGSDTYVITINHRNCACPRVCVCNVWARALVFYQSSQLIELYGQY